MELKYTVTGVLQCAILLLVLINSAQSACKQGSDWIEYQGNCYFWPQGYTKNWFFSEIDCKYYGGNLAIIRSQSENDFLLRMTQCSHNLWIGLVNTDPVCRGDRNCYIWWDISWPSNGYNALSTVNVNFQDCVYLGSNGTWHNTYCQNKYSFVCKSPAVQDSSNENSDMLLQPNEFTEISPAASNETDQYYNGTLAPTATPSPSRCPAGWKKLDNSCYFYSANKTNYFNAQMTCEEMGATVTSVLTQREHTLLTVALGCYSQSWIGLEKARPCFKRPGVDHCWVWMDRSPVRYLAWADSSQTVDRRDAECVIMEGQWKVTNCYNQFGFVCKKSVT